MEWVRNAPSSLKRRVRLVSTGTWTRGAGLFSSIGRSAPGQDRAWPETLSISRS
jgi:hypothetical protein